MRFSKLCDTYVAISRTSKRLEKTKLLADLLREVPEADMGDVVLLLKGRVFAEWDKTTIGISQKLAIRAISRASGASEEEVVRHFKKSGDLGAVAAQLAGSRRQATLAREDLTVAEVVRAVRKLATIEGSGSVDLKLKTIGQLLGNATPEEAHFLIRILLEDLRIGIADGTIRDAIVWWAVQAHEGLHYDPGGNSWAAPEGVDAAAVLVRWQEAIQNAIDRSNDVATVALTARKGLSGVAAVGLTLGTPTRVMLAQRALSIRDAFDRVGTPAGVEYKYDGFRMQIHRHGREVTLFTRRLENVTVQFPDVVAAIREHIAEDCIVDAEVVGYNPKNGRHVAFQQISQRIRRKYDIEKLAAELPVEVNVFDILLHKGAAVYPLPFTERRALIEALVPRRPLLLQPSELLVTEDEALVERFYKQALEAGYEGLMFKALASPYKPGSRVGFMVKLKPTLDTLDVAVVGAEWGEGKRSGWLTSFIIAVADEDGSLAEIGRVGTGFKELEQEGGATFEEMTGLLRDDIVGEEGKVVRLRPKVVLEVKFEEIQKSPSYGSGFALRFPRVVRIRADRRADEVSTLADVLDLYEAQRGRNK